MEESMKRMATIVGCLSTPVRVKPDETSTVVGTLTCLEQVIVVGKAEGNYYLVQGASGLLGFCTGNHIAMWE